ncbi:CapA family protein [Gordonia sp. CPCC 206044]|uniref:CapA family protein n=1 Tax=Gordonia sp. CPCC 206044 TaxID=3140793 RepID=UPI003AF3751B
MTKQRSSRRGLWRWVIPVAATALVLGLAATTALRLPDRIVDATDDHTGAAWGAVVDETGAPIAGASVQSGGAVVRADAKGEFSLPLPAPALASATSAGHLARTQAVSPGEPTRIVLTSHADESTALRFGGDVMFGGPFTQNRSGTAAPLVHNASAGARADLLSGVAPLMDDADLSMVNLETPLIDDPGDASTTPRPRRFHPTKPSVVASATASAQALRMSGVDVVSLANDHVFDALGPGLDSTMSALDDAGVVHFGAGRDEDEAWAPAIVPRRHGKVAFIGCTTVDGERTPVPYVADDHRPGAAECTTKRIERAVRGARARADTVVFAIHGGTQYNRQQSPTVRRMSDAAARAGAAIVVGGHPHATGGLRTVGSTVVAESMGNLLYEPSRWSSSPSGLLRVDVRGGRAVHTTSDPLMIADSRPVPVVGALADSAARIAAGTVAGAARLRGPGAEITAAPSAPPRVVDTALPPGVPQRLAPGWFVGTAPDGVRVGNDLLWGSGRFEAQDADPGTRGVELWRLGRAARVSTSAACADTRDPDVEGDGTADGRGLELVRSPKSTKDVFATTSSRIDTEPGRRLSLLAAVRSASPGSTLEIRWYGAAMGKSIGSQTVEIGEGDHPRGDCAQVRIDAVVPPGVVAAQPFVRLRPPDDSLSGPSLAIDDVRLVDWAPSGTAGRGFDTVERTGPGTVRFTGDRSYGRGPLIGNGSGNQ